MLDRETLKGGERVRVKDSLPPIYDQTLKLHEGFVHIVHIDSVSVNIRGVLRRLPFAHLEHLVEPSPDSTDKGKDKS